MCKILLSSAFLAGKCFAMLSIMRSQTLTMGTPDGSMPPGSFSTMDTTFFLEMTPEFYNIVEESTADCRGFLQIVLCSIACISLM